MNPVFSIVMNCKNGERYLKKALDSVYKQTYKDWEVIFFDNGSTDGSISIASSYDSRIKIHAIKNSINLGMARQKAVDLCVGNYVCFLDVDDIYIATKLEDQLRIFEEKKVKLISGGINIINTKDRILRNSVPEISGKDLFESLLKKYQLFMPTVAIDLKYMQENHHNFDPNLCYSPDYKLFMTIAQETDICISKEIYAQYRIHDLNLSVDMRKVAGSEWIYAIEYLQSDERLKYLSKRRKKAFKYIKAQARMLEALKPLHERDRWGSIRELCLIRPLSLRSVALLIILFLPFPTSFLLKIIYFGR